MSVASYLFPVSPKMVNTPLYQSPTLIWRQVPGVDGLLFGLKPAELGSLGQVLVDDPPHSSIDHLAWEHVGGSRAR
jgi:hypothetical protein